MSENPDATITFTAGRYQGDAMRWAESPNAATATISVELFRAIFDAAGEETIDTTGDIDPVILLGIVGLGPRGAEEQMAWLRLVCRCVRRRGLRVRFALDEPGAVARPCGAHADAGREHRAPALASFPLDVEVAERGAQAGGAGGGQTEEWLGEGGKGETGARSGLRPARPGPAHPQGEEEVT